MSPVPGNCVISTMDHPSHMASIERITAPDKSLAKGRCRVKFIENFPAYAVVGCQHPELARRIHSFRHGRGLAIKTIGLRKLNRPFSLVAPKLVKHACK